MDFKLSRWAHTEHLELLNFEHSCKRMVNGWRIVSNGHGMGRCIIQKGQCRRSLIAHYYKDNCIRRGSSLRLPQR